MIATLVLGAAFVLLGILYLAWFLWTDCMMRPAAAFGCALLLAGVELGLLFLLIPA